MQVTLNTDKSAFCTIGNVSFTFGEPGPLEVDVSSLNETAAKQLWYNIQRGVLEADDTTELRQLLEVSQPKEQRIQPVRKPQKSFEQLLEDSDKELKRILAGTVPSVKKEAARLRAGQLRKLLDFEQEGKARKGLMNYLSAELEKYTSTVTMKIGEESLEAQDRVKITELSTQLEDIVESEEEEITFNLPSE